MTWIGWSIVYSVWNIHLDSSHRIGMSARTFLKNYYQDLTNTIFFIIDNNIFVDSKTSMMNYLSTTRRL